MLQEQISKWGVNGVWREGGPDAKPHPLRFSSRDDSCRITIGYVVVDKGGSSYAISRHRASPHGRDIRAVRHPTTRGRAAWRRDGSPTTSRNPTTSLMRISLCSWTAARSGRNYHRKQQHIFRTQASKDNEPRRSEHRVRSRPSSHSLVRCERHRLRA